MNRNMSHRFTFESKRTFYFTKISKSFPLVTSCPTACPVSQGSDKPPPPILRYGTRPSTDRAVRVLPRRYRDNRGPPRLWWSDIHPDIGPVSQINHQSTAPPARGGRAIISGFRRQLEGRNPGSLVYAFSGTLPQSASIWIPASPTNPCQHGFEAGFKARRLASPPEHFWAGTAPFLGIFAALSRS